MKQLLSAKFLILITLVILISSIFLPIINGINLKNNDDSKINDEIHITYNFLSPSLTKKNIAGIDYNRILSPGLEPAGKTGEPLVPSKGVYILLPPESKTIDINVNPIGVKKIISNYYIEPMERSKTLSELKTFSIPEIDEEIYDIDSFYPGELYTEVNRYYFRGYQILVLLLHPIQYNPNSGEINYYSKMDVTIKTTSYKEISPLFRGLGKDAMELQRKVDNPQDIILYDNLKSNTLNLKSGYDLLIITTDDLEPYFQDLKEDHDSRGIFTEIRTLSDLGFSRKPEDIRDFIIDEYKTNDIEYVLLGGDDDIIPAKIIYVTGMDEEQWPVNANMPVDLYYACLDDNGPKDDGGDLIAEVFVGRACVGSSTEVSNFCEKTITYMDKRKGSDNFLDNILLAGEYKGDYGISSYGGNQMDQLVDGCSDDGYTTVGFPSDEYYIDKLYDRDLPTKWLYKDIIDKMNEGKQIIIHTGHANYNSVMRINAGMITSEKINNYLEPFFAYSTGCKSGGFDDPEGNTDCIAEYFTVKSLSGAFSGIWNARWGFFWSFRLDGDSSRYQREFIDAVFGEKIYNIAKANHDSREDNLHLIERSCMRFVYFGLNLFGDPSVSFHISFPPEKPEIPVGSNTINISEEQNFSTTSSDPEGDQLYYFWDWGDGDYSNWLGPYDSGDICIVSHIWNEKGSFDIKVKVKDQYGEDSPWSDSLSITVSKKKSINYSPRILVWLFGGFPFLHPFFNF